MRWALAFVFALLAIDASAAPPSYVIVRFTGLLAPLPPVDVVLNDRAEIAYTNTNSLSSTTSLTALLRTGSTQIDQAGGSFNELSALRVRGFTDARTVLYSADYIATDPRLRSLMSWSPLTGNLELFTKLRAEGGGLDDLPDIDDGGTVAFREILSKAPAYRFRTWENGTTTNLASCNYMSDARPVEDRANLLFECRPSAIGTPSVIYRGTGPPFAPFVDDSLFGGNPGRYLPLGTNRAGTLLFQRTVAPEGIYTKTTSGAPVFVTSSCADAELNDLNQVMCRRTASINIVNTADPHVVVVIGMTIGTAEITALGSLASLNDLGQVAFSAELSDGTAGIYLATPSTCDSDADGWCDVHDNCPSFADATQLDLDSDGFGNRCDNCPLHANADQTDTDGDGRGDGCPPCTASGPTRCGLRVKSTAGEELFAIPDLPLDDLPPRPRMLGLVKSLTPGLNVVVSMADPNSPLSGPACEGGTLSSQGSPFSTLGGTSTTGMSLIRIFDSYLTDAARTGASCSYVVRATGPPGVYTWLADNATLIPNGSNSYYESDGGNVEGTAFTPGNTTFIGEATNYRFLYDGTGAPTFGKCTWDGVPTGDNAGVDYSPAIGPGWDCCTYQFDGWDGVDSTVGQLVFNVEGAPPPPDSDQDAFLSPCDNCDFLANDQLDGGGINTTTQDQIGDACQCGRLATDAVVNANDVTALRNHLRATAPLNATQLARCSVIGGANECTIRTLTVLRRALVTPQPLGPGVAQTCDAALP